VKLRKLLKKMAIAILSLKWQNTIKIIKIIKIIKAVEVIKIINAAICSKLRYLASNSRAIRSNSPQIAKIAT